MKKDSERGRYLNETGFGVRQEIKWNRISAETEHMIFILLEYKV